VELFSLVSVGGTVERKVLKRGRGHTLSSKVFMTPWSQDHQEVRNNKYRLYQGAGEHEPFFSTKTAAVFNSSLQSMVETSVPNP
jgi:hypothetical protein